MDSSSTAAPPPDRCEIERLPEDLLSATLARTAPRDACRAALVSPAFRAAADADAVWSSFLPPRDLPALAHGELELELEPEPEPEPELPADRPQSSTTSSKKRLFMRLSDPASPVLLADGLTSMWLDRATGAKCFMLSARKLGIAWGHTPQYWRWIPVTTASRFSEAAELQYVWWLEIRGEMESRTLTRHTAYSAYIVFRVSGAHRGLRHPCQQASVGVGAGSSRSRRRVCLDDGGRGSSAYDDTRRRHGGDVPQDAVFPRVRRDGWAELELGEFCSGGGDDGEVSICLMETTVVKRGLVVLGIEIRPKK